MHVHTLNTSASYTQRGNTHTSASYTQRGNTHSTHQRPTHRGETHTHIRVIHTEENTHTEHTYTHRLTHTQREAFERVEAGASGIYFIFWLGSRRTDGRIKMGLHWDGVRRTPLLLLGLTALFSQAQGECRTSPLQIFDTKLHSI